MRKNHLLQAISAGVILASAGAFPATAAGFAAGYGQKADRAAYKTTAARAPWRGHRARWGARRHSFWRASVSAASVEAARTLAVQDNEQAHAADAPEDGEARLDRRFMARFAEEPEPEGLMSIVGPTLRRIGRLISLQDEKGADAAMMSGNDEDAAVIGHISAQWVKKVSPNDVRAAAILTDSTEWGRIRDVAGGWQARLASPAGR